MFQQMMENKGDINPPKRRLIQIKKASYYYWLLNLVFRIP